MDYSQPNPLDSISLDDYQTPLDSIDLNDPFNESAPVGKKGGFINAAKNVAGSTLSGTGHVLKDIGLESVGNSAIAKGKEIQDNNPAAVNSFSDIAKNPGTWVAESAGGMAGQAGEALAGGVVGGYLGGGLGALTGPLAPVAIPALSAAGAYVGGNIPMLVQEYGSERDQQSKNGIDDKKRALAGAAATTAIENLGGFKPGGMAGQGKKIVSDLAGKTTKEAVKTLVKKGVKSGVSEGLEEIPQQYTGAYGGGTDIKDLNTTENAQDAAFGAAMAFPGGAMFGSVNTVSDHYKAKRNEALDQTASTGPLGNALASGGLANTDTFNPADGSITDSTAVDIAANSHASSYDQLFQQAESNYGLPAGLLSTMGFHESGFDPNAVSSAGARGVMQFMPATAQEYGIDPHDTPAAINAAGKKMSGLINYYKGDISKAIAAYNFGEGNVDKTIARAGDNWQDELPPETQVYLSRILGGQEATTTQANTNNQYTDNADQLNNFDQSNDQQTLASDNNNSLASGLESINTLENPYLSTQAENQNGSQKTDESTNETSTQEKGSLLNTDAPEQSGVTPNLDALAEQLHTAIATDNSKQPDQHYADIVASNKLTPQQSDDLITKYQGIAEQVNNEQTNKQTETQAQDQTSADQRTKLNFQPTHTLEDGTPVVASATQDGAYYDESGNGRLSWDAKPISRMDTTTTNTSREGSNTRSNPPSYATAPLLNKRTNKPFKTRKMAEAAIASSSNPTLNKQDHIAVPVDGGFGITPKPNTTQESNDTTAETQSVLSNTGTNAKGITAPATTDATGQGSTQTAQEVDKQPWQMTHDEYWKAEDKKYEANRLERLAKVNNELDTLKNKGEGYDAIIAKEIGKVPHTITNDGKFSHNLRSGSYKHNNAHEFVVRQLLKRRKSIESSSGRFRNSFVNDNKNHHAAIQKAIDEGRTIPQNVLDSLPSNFPEFKMDAKAINQPSNTQATATVAKPEEIADLSNNDQANKQLQQNTQSIIPKDSKKLGLAITRAAKIENRVIDDMPGSYNQGSEHHGIDIHSINQVKDANGNTDYIVDVSNHTRVASNGHKTVDGKYSLNQLLSSGAISQKTHDFFVSEHDQATNASPETSNDHELTAQQYVDRENKSFPDNKKINDTLRKSHYTAIRSHLDQGGKISQEVFDSLDGLRRTNLKNNYGEGVVKSPAQETANPIQDTTDVSKKGENVDTAKPEWHIDIPEHGLAILPAELKGEGYRTVAGRIAKDAVEAITQNQKIANDTLYLYFLPAAENYNAIARYFPEDQKPGSPWQISDSQGVRVGSLTNDQLLYKTESILGNKPILGWEKTSTNAVNVIGKGNSGDVTRIDNEVEKNATGNEAKVYELLKGVEGVAKGYEHDGKIRLPFYEHIISIDTIPKDDRESLGSLVSKNKDRIISAVNSLTNIGYDYNDPLQFGMNKDQQFDLLDFSMAENNFPKEVRNNNLNRLSSFFKQFGAEKIGKAISHVANVLTEQKFQAQYPDMAYTTHEGIDYPALTERLGGKVATHAYYATNARYIQLKDTGIAQTELVNGIKVILSNHAISESDIKQWEMTSVVYGSTTKQEKVAQAVKPALGKYIQSKATASAEDQKRLANRGSRIATLSSLNEAVRNSNPDYAYSDSEIQSAADDKIDAGIDWLISKQKPTEKLTTKGAVIADKAENIQDLGEKIGAYQGELWSYQGQPAREIVSVNENYINFATKDSNGKDQESYSNFITGKKYWSRIDDSVGQTQKDYVKNEANSQENSYDNSGKDNTRTTEDPARNISKTINQSGVSNSQSKESDQSRAGSSETGIRSGSGQYDSINTDQSKGDGLSRNERLGRYQTDVSTEYSVGRKTSTDTSLSGSVGANNLSLIDKPAIELTPAKRRDVNILAETILKKPVNDITEDDKDILRQYTGHGGLDVKASADKGEGIFNQHYSAYDTIKAMYGALMDAGIKMDNNLEPSVGSGNFIGMHPRANWTAVDIDTTNTEVVRRLYPDASVFNESYETFRGKNFDLIISNVPFASFSSLAREHAGIIKPAFKAIHNFFFAQSVDKLKTGGVMAFMTSTGTMDGIGEGQRLREHLIQKMDVIGAFRLPMGTQKANASTEVMIDVIFLQKRPDGVVSKQPEKNQAFVDIANKEGYKINQYFVDYPEAVLGDLSIGANKTSMGKVGWIVTGDADYSKMILESQDYSATTKSSRSEFTTPETAQAYAIKKGLKFTDNVSEPYFQDGIIFDTPVTYSEVSGSGLFGRKATGVQAEKLAALKQIDETHDAKLVQQYEEKYSKAPHVDKQLTLWAKVNYAGQQLKSYLALFDKHFNLSEIFTKQVRFTNSGKIEIDEHSSLMDRAESLENADGIFSPKTDLISANEIQDLLTSGDYAQLSNGSLQNSRLYYAGNIYKKIDDATKVKPASQRDKQLAKLNRVKPALWTIDKISFTGKEAWLPASAIASIGIQNYADGTKLIGGNAITDNHLLHLYNQYINNDDLVKKDSKETPEEYADRLKAAQALVHTEILPLIKQKILDDGLGNEVVEAYNREKNFFAAPIFDGSSLRNLPTKFKGKPFQLMLHQLEGAERAIYNKKGVLAFSPGLGKTPTAIIIADQLLQKGVMKKPLFIVPANTIPQWESSTRSLYPNAKVYEFPKYKTGINKGKVKEWPSMTAADKEQMVYDLTNNQYDYTFISTNLAQKFSIPAKKLSQYLDELTESISSMEKPNEELTKSQIKAKETRIAKIRMLKATMMDAYKESIDTGFDMGKMGFDALFADEVQYYKNIGMQSEDAKGGIGANVVINAKYPLDADGKQDKTSNPLSVTLGSSRSYDFRFKTRFISENNNGNNIFLLTGTPTPNKPLELMTLLHHLDIHILDEYGINNVGDFVNEFFDIQEVEETGIDGTNKLQAALVAIMNIPALKSIITRFIDYRSPESAKDLTRPKQIDKVHTILRNDASEEIFADVQTRILKSIDDARAKKSGDKGVIVEPMIKMYGAGRDASIDVRLYTPSVDKKGDIAPGTLFEKETRSDYSKIAKTVELVAAKNKLDPEAGQLIFLDRLKFSGDNGSTHEDIRNDILKATGLDPKEVIFVSGQAFVNPDTGKQVSSGPKPEALQKIMDYYNEGKIKVLIGNTSKLGVGVDLQVTTTDIYQIDKPYRPDEIEQRNNRGVRQGNRNSEVTVHTFNQPGTFDAMSDRIIANKQGFNDVFWKEQVGDKADVKAEEAPSAYDAAIELEQDPFRKRKLEIERDLSGAANKSSNIEKQVSNLAKRIKTATTNHDAYITANNGIDNRPAPLYEDQSESERKKSLAAFKVRMAEQRAKNVVRISDLAKDIIQLTAEKDVRQAELEAHKEYIASIRSKYVVNGVVSLDRIREAGDVKFSKSTAPVVNPHSKTSLNQAVTKAMDTLFGQGWTNRLMATGKFKMISAAEATGLIGKNAMFHKVWHGSPHDHNGFDSANIGTGEGAQAFGWGHYFSDLKTVAEWYRDTLQKKQVKLLVDGKDVTELAGNSYSIERRALGILLDELKYPNMGAKNGLSEDQIKTIIDKVILEQTPRSGENDPNYLKSLEKIRDYLTDLKNKKLEIGKGKLYEVDLAPKQDEYLDWDKPLSDQSDVVKAGLKELHKQLEGDLLNEYLDRINADWSELTGQELYQKILQRSHQDGLFDHPDIYDRSVPDDEASSHLLHSLGIRGIRYKAEAGQSDANNYVVFNDADVKIEVKYSKNGDVIAFYNPANDTTYLVHDNITQNTSDKALQGLMLHEIGVHALTLGKSNEAFKDILRRFEALKKTNPKVQAAFDRVPKDTKSEDIVEEALAYYLEENPRSSLAQRIVEWFRQAVRALGKTLPVLERAKFSQWANKLTEAELIGMATSALKSAPDSLQFDNVGRQKENIKLEQQQQRFYSALRKAFRDAPDKVFGNPEQVKLWIAGNSAKFDVKKDEIYWSGINDWLGMQTGKVSKADVLNYLDQNGVQVEDVMLGGIENYMNDVLKGTGYSAEIEHDEVMFSDEDGEYVGFSDLPKELQKKLNKTPEESKYGGGSLVIPGGRDYKELVITIPTTEKFNESDSTHFGDVGKGKQIAWLRMDTRTDANGKDTLFLEEVQSQRGQHGRTNGFLKETKRPAKYPYSVRFKGDWASSFVTKKEAEDFITSELKGNEANDYYYGKEASAKDFAIIHRPNVIDREGEVPPAPFVTDSNNKATNAYISLLLKKAISHAIDNGHVSVSWTTGDQQADRYELSKQLDKLTIKRDAYGTYDIDGIKDGELVVGKVNVEEEELASIVGKDISEKAIAGQTVFEGDGLKVGGAWTQSMYGDENGLNAQGKPSMITQAAMEIARKMGGEMGSVGIETDHHGAEYNVVDDDSNSDLPIRLESRDTEELIARFKTRDAAWDEIDRLSIKQQPALIITPTMKAKILNEGMPLFSKAKVENSESNNIKFSRSTPSNTPADNSAMRSFFAPAKGKQALGWLAGLFQRNHLIDFVAKDLPELINYKLLSQEKDNFTNQREQEIAKSYKEMMDKMDKKTMHELGRVQGMATRLVKFDPALADDNTPMTEEELAVYDAYTAMPDTAKEVYATMRDAYQADLMEKKRALIERIRAFPADRETQAEIIRTIEKHFDQFKEGVYFPLNRDGAVIVKATNAEGDLVIEHVATQADAYKLIKEMQDQGYENTHILGKDAYDRDLLAGNAANEMAALAHRTISDLKEKSVQGKLTDADFNDLFSEFNQLLINTLPDSSYRKHFIHRKGTLGESTDTLRAYAKTRTSAVKMIASLTYDHQIQAVLNDADKTIKDMDKVPGSDTLAIKSILNELKLREAALKSTEINAMSQVLTSLGFMGALGFNIGSAAVNMLQVMGVALPELSGRHGEVEAMKEIASAYKLLFNPATLNRSSGFDVTKNPNISDITKQAIERLKKIGKIDLTMTHDAIAMGKNPSYSSNLMTRSLGSAAKYSGYFFHVAEAANRQITGMAAFNLAYQKNGGNFEAAIAEAVDVIDRTQFDYGQGNRARYMMSNTARVLTLFKAYALGMSYYIGRNAYQSMKGETPEVRLQARKTLVVSMAMSFATAGLFGMPIGIEAFAGIGGVAAFKYKGAYFAVPGAIGGMLIFRALLEGLGADDDDELETEFRNWLTDNFDQTTAEWVTKGPARLLPIGDISGRTSLSELWWRSQNKQLEGTDQYNAIATALIGPIGSQIAGLFTAKKMYEDGQYSRMVESMSPAFMRNAIAATRMSQDGVRNLKGDKIIERDLTPVELINKVIGFNPTVVTNTYDANSAIAKESTKHTLAKSHLVNRWLSGDATERSDLMKGDIKDFNESVSPSERITLKNLFASMKARKGIDKHTQNGLYLSKKQNYLRDIGRFNRQE